MAPSTAFTQSAPLVISRPSSFPPITTRPTPTVPASSPCRHRLVSCATPQREPVEQGVQLPPLTPDALQSESTWLSSAVTSWLDTEWATAEPAPVHAAIGERVAAIYRRQRMEGEDDLSGILLAVGQELESFDMSDAFVGAFNVANKVADLIIEHRLGPREKMPEYARSDDAPVWSEGKDEELRRGRGEKATEGVPTRAEAAPVPPSLADKFDRFMFLKQVIDGTAGTNIVSGAVAIIVGFVYDREREEWSAAGVKDGYFKRFGNIPSEDVLGDEKLIDHLAFRLAEDDEDGTRAEALDIVIEAYHGYEITKVMREKNSQDFSRRVVVAKFMHMFGGF